MGIIVTIDWPLLRDGVGAAQLDTGQRLSVSAVRRMACQHGPLPALLDGAVGIFALAWGEVLFASVLTRAPTRTLAVGLDAYGDQATVWWNQLAAAALFSCLPVLAAAFVARWLLDRRPEL